MTSEKDNQKRNPSEALNQDTPTDREAVFSDATKTRATLKRDAIKKEIKQDKPILIAGDTGATPPEDTCKKDYPKLDKIRDSIKKSIPGITIDYWEETKYEIEKFESNKADVIKGVKQALEKFDQKQQEQIKKISFIVGPAGTGTKPAGDGDTVIEISYLQTPEQIEQIILEALRDDFKLTPPTPLAEISTYNLDNIDSSTPGKFTLTVYFKNPSTRKPDHQTIEFTKKETKDGDESIIYNSDFEYITLEIPSYDASHVTLIDRRANGNSIEVQTFDLTDDSNHLKAVIARAIGDGMPRHEYNDNPKRKPSRFPHIFIAQDPADIKSLLRTATTAAIENAKMTRATNDQPLVEDKFLLTTPQGVTFYVDTTTGKVAIRESSLIAKGADDGEKQNDANDKVNSILYYFKGIKDYLGTKLGNQVTIEAGSKIDKFFAKSLADTPMNLVLSGVTMQETEALENLAWKGSSIQELDLNGCIFDEKVLYSLIVNNKLKRLRISNDPNKHLPDWMFKDPFGREGAIRTDKLVTLELVNCANLHSVNFLTPDILPNLKSLDLSGCKNLRYRDGLDKFIKKDWPAGFTLNLTDTGIDEISAIEISKKLKGRSIEATYPFTENKIENEMRRSSHAVEILGEEDAVYLDSVRIIPEKIIFERADTREPGVKDYITSLEQPEKIQGVSDYDTTAKQEILAKIGIVKEALDELLEPVDTEAYINGSGLNAEEIQALLTSTIYLNSRESVNYRQTFGFQTTEDHRRNIIVIGNIGSKADIKKNIIKALESFNKKASIAETTVRNHIQRFGETYNFASVNLETQNERKLFPSEIAYLQDGFLEQFKQKLNEILSPLEEEDRLAILSVINLNITDKPQESNKWWKDNKYQLPKEPTYTIDLNFGRTMLKGSKSTEEWSNFAETLTTILAKYKYKKFEKALEEKNKKLKSLHIALSIVVMSHENFSTKNLRRITDAADIVDTRLTQEDRATISATIEKQTSDYKIKDRVRFNVTSEGVTYQDKTLTPIPINGTQEAIEKIMFDKLKEFGVSNPESPNLKERLKHYKWKLESIDYIYGDNSAEPSFTNEDLSTLHLLKDIKTPEKRLSGINIIVFDTKTNTDQEFNQDDLAIDKQSKSIYVPLPLTEDLILKIENAIEMVNPTQKTYTTFDAQRPQTLDASEETPFSDEEFGKTEDYYGNEVVLRKTALFNFEQAQIIASDMGYKLRVRDSFRSYQDQVQFFKDELLEQKVDSSLVDQLNDNLEDKDRMANLIEAWNNDPNNPDLKEKIARARRDVAMPYGEYPPHLSGGAMDIYAIPIGEKEETFSRLKNKEDRKDFARKYTDDLNTIMTRAGFVRYNDKEGNVAEFWHFEYGTRRWAANTKDEIPKDFAPYAIQYTPVREIAESGDLRTKALAEADARRQAKLVEEAKKNGEPIPKTAAEIEAIHQKKIAEITRGLEAGNMFIKTEALFPGVKKPQKLDNILFITDRNGYAKYAIIINKDKVQLLLVDNRHDLNGKLVDEDALENLKPVAKRIYAPTNPVIFQKSLIEKYLKQNADPKQKPIR